jgi:hypothetical protein
MEKTRRARRCRYERYGLRKEDDEPYNVQAINLATLMWLWIQTIAPDLVMLSTHLNTPVPQTPSHASTCSLPYRSTASKPTYPGLDHRFRHSPTPLVDSASTKPQLRSHPLPHSAGYQRLPTQPHMTDASMHITLLLLYYPQTMDGSVCGDGSGSSRSRVRVSEDMCVVKWSIEVVRLKVRSMTARDIDGYVHSMQLYIIGYRWPVL